MKYIQAVAKPSWERVPEFFRILAGASYITETRLYDWNPVETREVSALFEVDGELDQFKAATSDIAGIRSVDTTPVTDDRFTLLAVLQPDEVPLFEEVFSAVTQRGIVVAKPVVYRDRQVRARIVGSAKTLQAAISELPEAIEFQIAAVGDFTRQRENPMSGLSDRQREVLLMAFEMGYYEHPREATHEDIAQQFDRTPHTISEHLQKAEAKIIDRALELEARDGNGRMSRTG
ncbi:MAG: helix-turn-helix domain-containing protein [Halobacteriales archaeon]|nr:helix-turn-helix domain-containing protein [Halobacteriales archaeon]